MYDNFDSTGSIQTKSGTGGEGEGRVGAVFWLLVIIAQALGIAIAAIIGIKMGPTTDANGTSSGGYIWNDDNVFNFHPLFMILSLVVMYGDAILIYRVFRTQPKLYIKILHAAMHISAMAIASVGLRAAFAAHKAWGLADFGSVHSWVGISTFILFCLQWFVGFCSFLLPLLPEVVKARVLHFHRFVGAGMLNLAVATCLLKLAPQEATHLNNALILLLIVFSIVTSYILFNEPYKRPPNPSIS